MGAEMSAVQSVPNPEFAFVGVENALRLSRPTPPSVHRPLFAVGAGSGASTRGDRVCGA